MQKLVTAILLAASFFVQAEAVPEGGDDLVGRLHQAKLSLIEGVSQIEAEHGPAISGKFEIKKDKLVLSVYTVKHGIDVTAEKNGLLELKGDATTDYWEPALAVFEDRAHLTRASTQLTLFQVGLLSFKEVISLVEKSKKGMIYSVKPRVMNKAPVAVVLVATEQNDTETVLVNLTTGKVLED